MTIIFTFLLALIGIFGGLVGSNFNSAQSSASDSISKNEIGTISRGLELLYTETGYYLSAETIESSTDAELSSLLGLYDTAILYDQNEARINTQNSVYTYVPALCETSTDGIVECQKYVIIAQLNDGTTIEEVSLN